MSPRPNLGSGKHQLACFCSVLVVAFASPVPSPISPVRQAHAQQDTATRDSRAGAAWTDITPYPGLPTGGYGIAGAKARGYWGRLRATAFYFEDRAGRGLALVSADLFAMPSGLHQSVAAHFTSDNPDNRTGVVLPLERLVLAATHTHQGPGNYLSAEVYNKRGSKTGGFNRELRLFLHLQIVRAIELAILDARAGESNVDVVAGVLDTPLFVNRSPTVFLRDAKSQAILAALGQGIASDVDSCLQARKPEEPSDDWNIDGCPRLRAVDRNITLLRIRRANQTHAAAVFINVHPTVVHSTTELNTADVFGIARAQLEQRLASPPAVIAFFNGSEGDVVTRRGTRTAVDLWKAGDSLAGEVRRIHNERPAVALDWSPGVHGRLHFARPGDSEPHNGGVIRLAREAIAGVATLGGGEGDETGVPFAKPRTRKPKGDHGVKVPAFGWFRCWFQPPDEFPQALPLGIVRLGGVMFATMPTETSTAAAWRIRKALGGLPHGQLEIISMANEYASYLATADEYGAQDYMGASTLWGPQQAAFFAAVLGRLAQEPDALTGHPSPDIPGPDRVFSLGDVGRFRPRPHDGFDRLLEGGLVSGDALPAFEWCTATPPSFAGAAHHVEVVSENGSWRDRAGIAVVLRGIRGKPRVVTWAAIWLTPLWEDMSGGYRFVVIDGLERHESDVFEVGTSPQSACQPAARLRTR